jgi:hypothetical protein
LLQALLHSVVPTKPYRAKTGNTVTRKYWVLTLSGYRPMTFAHELEIALARGVSPARDQGADSPHAHVCTLIQSRIE